MWILVHHAGQQLGPFKEDEIRAALQAGTVLPSDLAWAEGTPAWVPLSSMLTGVKPAPAPFAGAGWPAQSYQPPAPTSPLAIASFVLGVVSIVFCFTFITGIPAIFCGHAARAQIDRGHPVQKGDGLAVAGLIMGYLVTLPIILGLLFAYPMMLSVGHYLKKEFFDQNGAEMDSNGESEPEESLKPPPTEAVRAAQDSINEGRAQANARVLAQACRDYAREHADTYPKTLEELLPAYVTNLDRLTCPSRDQPGAIGFWYFGDGDTHLPEDAVLLMSKGVDDSGKRIVARVDGTVGLEQSEAPKPAR